MMRWFTRKPEPEPEPDPAQQAREALQRTMRPDPEARSRRLAQFTPERRARYWANVEAAYSGE